MGQQTRLKLRIIAIIIALLATLMQLGFIIIPMLQAYVFWFAVASCLLLIIAN
jgi:hypothetical protein